MAIEIERKFLVNPTVESIIACAKGCDIKQGYVSFGGKTGMTVRARQVGDHGLLTLTGRTTDISCAEYEWEIPLPDVSSLLNNHAITGMTARARQAGDHGFLTLKGPSTGISCAEYEWEIPLPDVSSLLNDHAIEGLIEKTRYRVRAEGMRGQSGRDMYWEIDVFSGKLAGLIVAEIELEDEAQTVVRPDWIGLEVSSDWRYKNSNLLGKSFPLSSSV